VVTPFTDTRAQATPRRCLRHASAFALLLFGAGCAEVARDTRSDPSPAGAMAMRQQREAEMNREWQNRPLAQLVAVLGKPRLTMGIPGGGNPPGFVVVYGEDGASGCIDAFAMNVGREPTVRLYYCR
jgi:hypothetical protein